MKDVLVLTVPIAGELAAVTMAHRTERRSISRASLYRNGGKNRAGLRDVNKLQFNFGQVLQEPATDRCSSMWLRPCRDSRHSRLPARRERTRSCPARQARMDARRSRQGGVQGCPHVGTAALGCPIERSSIISVFGIGGDCPALPGWTAEAAVSTRTVDGYHKDMATLAFFVRIVRCRCPDSSIK